MIGRGQRALDLKRGSSDPQIRRRSALPEKRKTFSLLSEPKALDNLKIMHTLTLGPQSTVTHHIHKYFR